MTGDSVVKTLAILFVIAMVPCLLAVAVAVGWVWVAAVSHG